MAFVEPQFSRNQVNRAGHILVDPESFKKAEVEWATVVLANWRAAHTYPINTFQATLRQKLAAIDEHAIVAQRLKRAPSIVAKLTRFNGMQLARMQDIGGLRAVVDSVAKVKRLEAAYRASHFGHRLTSSKDYIEEPKADGYRSTHLIYRYANPKAPIYDGLSLELQFRTRLQHAWATAVETTGTFLGQALKSGQGERQWRKFFAASSAALSVRERTAPVPGYEGYPAAEVFAEVASLEKNLRVLEKLEGFAIAADKITKLRGQGAYHLIILNSIDRSVSIQPYPLAQLEQATSDYAAVEVRATAGEAIEAVLVSAGPVDALRKAYPNYFLDTQVFVTHIRNVIRLARRRNRPFSRRPPRAQGRLFEE